MLSDSFFYSVITFSLRARSLSSCYLQSLHAHFIQGLFGLSEPFKAKFVEEITRLTQHRSVHRRQTVLKILSI